MTRLPSSFAVLVLALLVPRLVLAQTTSPVPAEVRAAQEFLFAAYPDLVRQPLAVQLKPDGAGGWLVSVTDAPPPTRPGEAIVPQAPLPVLLRATLAFDARGRIEQYRANGPYLYDGANAVLRDQVRRHPQWIESDADVELMRMGGEATTGRAFVPAARPDSTGVSRHLGGSVATSPPRFTLRGHAPDAATSIVTALWVVDVVATDSSGPAVPYAFTYEPFGGRLVSVTKVGGAP